MALSDVATAQLWETFRAGGGAELIRDAVRLVFQELIEAEAIGAGRYERSDTRTNERNGHRARLLATQAGDVELRIPKLRRGSFMPSVIEPRRRIDRALHAVVRRPMWRACRPARWTTWSPLWARSRASPNRRCLGSAPGSTRPWRRSGAAAADAWDRVAAQLADAFPKAGPLMADAKADVLAFAAFPKCRSIARCRSCRAAQLGPSGLVEGSGCVDRFLEGRHLPPDGRIDGLCEAVSERIVGCAALQERKALRVPAVGTRHRLSDLPCRGLPQVGDGVAH